MLVFFVTLLITGIYTTLGLPPTWPLAACLGSGGTTSNFNGMKECWWLVTNRSPNMYCSVVGQGVGISGKQN